jgi:anti-anti-sigma regulatory factor
VVFSLFTRKDKADPRKAKAGDPANAPAPMPNGSAVSPAKATTAMARTPVRADTNQASSKSTAMQTMAKIDAIESEMNLNGPEPTQPRGLKPSISTFATQPAQRTDVSTNSAPLDFGTSAILGDTAGAGNLEILGSGYAPVLEEAAILFSNGQTTEAASLLQSSIADNDLGQATQTVWMMLFDVYQALNKETEFESLSIDYAARFESSPPAWRGKKAVDTQKANTNAAVVIVPPVLDQAATKLVEQIQAAVTKNRPVLLELSKLQKVEPYGAEIILKTLQAFKKAKRELAVSPAEKLVSACRNGVEAGRRDTSDAVWLLLMEGLRLLNRQQEFEDTSIDFCVTYEVSPPSWEPMPEWIRAEANGSAGNVDSDQVVTRVEDGIFFLVGDLKGSIATESALLTDYASSRREVQIDCSDLRRIEFVAAGQLQNQLTTLRTLGKRVTLINTSIPVGTLFGVVGMGEIAGIHLREH